jgi:uncharacterized protein with PIN domain
LAQLIRATFRFYAELNDFLAPDRRYHALERDVPPTDTVKHVVESLGVPHTEIDLILINGKSATFSDVLQEGDYVSIFPVFESLDVRTLERLRPEPSRNLKFVLDIHLGGLAAYLRMLGFDSWYATNAPDDELANLSCNEGRVLLTRDVGLLKRSKVERGYFVRNTGPRLQLEEVVRRFDLLESTRPFSRCMRCNAELASVAKESIVDRLPRRTRELHTEFKLCPACDKVYWKGSHHDRMVSWIRELRLKFENPDSAIRCGEIEGGSGTPV